MTQERFVHETSGLEVESEDLQLLSECGAFADDQVLAELLRLPPFGGTVAKAVWPFDRAPTVAPNGASGSVLISPFRVIVGSRDSLQAIGPRRLWNDLRSGIFTGVSTLTPSLAIGPNSTGFARWDLVYASIAIDAVGSSALRYHKDAATEQVTTRTIPRTRLQRVTVGVVPGQAQANPPRPQLPPDAGGNYHVPLAYIRVPDNFGPNSVVAPSNIHEVFPHVPLARTTGAGTTRPASAPGASAWGAARPPTFLPPSMIGTETLLIPIDVADANPANWPIASGGVIDDSRDWRGRVFDWRAFVSEGTGSAFAWDASPGVTVLAPSATQAPRFAAGCGQSFRADSPPSAVAVLLEPSIARDMAPQSMVRLAVDLNDGALRLVVTGQPRVRAFVWLTASAPYGNR
jgi:hypothetical protein